MNDAGIGCRALRSLSIPAISHYRESSCQDPAVTVQQDWFPRMPSDHQPESRVSARLDAALLLAEFCDNVRHFADVVQCRLQVS